MKKFIDTAPLIYLIEGHPEFAQRVIDLFSTSVVKNDSFATSVITILEFGVKPEKEGRPEVIQNLYEMLAKLDTEILEVDEIIATKAYKLRAKYQFLKSMDSIQIASALISNCKEFITNDKKLKKVEEIIITLV